MHLMHHISDVFQIKRNSWNGNWNALNTNHSLPALHFNKTWKCAHAKWQNISSETSECSLCLNIGLDDKAISKLVKVSEYQFSLGWICSTWLQGLYADHVAISITLAVWIVN